MIVNFKWLTRGNNCFSVINNVTLLNKCKFCSYLSVCHAAVGRSAAAAVKTSKSWRKSSSTLSCVLFHTGFGTQRHHMEVHANVCDTRLSYHLAPPGGFNHKWMEWWRKYSDISLKGALCNDPKL